jgi:hypothetical protein
MRAQWEGVIISKKKKPWKWKVIEFFIWEGGPFWKYDRYDFKYRRSNGKIGKFHSSDPFIYNNLEVGDQIVKKRGKLDPEKR